MCTGKCCPFSPQVDFGEFLLVKSSRPTKWLISWDGTFDFLWQNVFFLIDVSYDFPWDLSGPAIFGTFVGDLSMFVQHFVCHIRRFDFDVFVDQCFYRFKSRDKLKVAEVDNPYKDQSLKDRNSIHLILPELPEL